jgi:tricorn protease
MKFFSTAAVFIFVASVAHAEAEAPLLLQRPTLSKTHIAFVHASDLWVVGRDGGEARRLTSGAGLETHPLFSPDGSQIAFAGQYEGNLDVYVVPTAGGVPRRLTYHPSPDLPVGWTPDGKAVLFRSQRGSYARFTRLYTVPVEGGLPTELPLPQGEEGSFSPDGKRIAYVPFTNNRPFPGGYIAWKRYRGGMASKIWIADLADSSIEKVPHDRANEFNPMWVDGTVYFLSDRDGPTTLFAYDLDTKKVKKVLENHGPDIHSASACADAIVYDQLGELHLYDLEAKAEKKVDVRVRGDLPGVRPRFEKVAKKIIKGGLSPTGTRAVFEARGEILTVPAEKGDIRNLTNTTGVAERDPAWSPDGKTIAYFSDESGEYELHLRPQHGSGEVKKIKLGDAPTFYYSPVWSPDSKRIAYTDKRLNVWYVDLDSGKSTHVDTHIYDEGPIEAPVWSPDGHWLAYTKALRNFHGAIFVYSLDTKKPHQLTDGMSDARAVVFDKNGKYLYFLASTDAGPAITGSMSSINRPVTRSVYVAVLNKEDTSPLAPESDEEKDAKDAVKKEDNAAGPGKEKEKKEPVKVRIDFEDFDQRILALPMPAKNYAGLLPGKAGSLLVVEAPPVMSEQGEFGMPGQGAQTLHRFDLEKRKADKVAEGLRRVYVSHNGEKVLYQQGERWVIAPTGAMGKPGEGGPPMAAMAAMAAMAGKPTEATLKIDDMEVQVDPQAEWRQIYREVWRLERDFLYAPNFHGLDIKDAEKRYARFLPGLASRDDLNYLLYEMLGELCLGHVYVMGGDVPEVPSRRGGLLGADYEIHNGRYQFAHVYRGENWNPKMQAPLTQPGVNVKEGEYLLAVNGREVKGTDEVYSFFEGTAGKQTVLKVGPNADGKGAREVTVVPLATEQPLRRLAWVDENRRKVEKMTDGRVAYVYIPDTALEGYTRFNRYFFPQAGKEGAVIDERFNGGGALADHVIDYLRQPLRNYVSTREGEDIVFPQGAIFGPKVMIINEQAGSGGDYMPYAFRQAKLGPLVGKRTWGGLVGIGGYPSLIDGGMVTAPRMALWFPSGDWEVENNGVAPDVEVDYDPKEVRAGKDPQLEKAVQLVLEEMKKNPLKKPARPAYPDYYKGAGKTGP